MAVIEIGSEYLEQFDANWAKRFQRLIQEVRNINPVSQKTIISSLDELLSENVAPVNGSWPAVNLAFFVPFTVYEQIELKRILVSLNSPVSGRVDVGIYRSNEARIVSSGLTISGKNLRNATSFGVMLPSILSLLYHTAGITELPIKRIKTILKIQLLQALIFVLCR